LTDPVTFQADAVTCAKCGTAIAPGLLRCPACRALTYADRLAELARTAELDTREGRVVGASNAWHEALLLLPSDAQQRGPIQAKLDALGAKMEAGGIKPPPRESHAGRNGILAAAGAGILFLLTKGKFLLFGLTKLGTLVSMFAFLGVYWQAYGWALAAGLVVSIYLHELGHVAALRQYGIPVSAPMFVPGLGAYVRHGVLPTERIGARVGFAGPAAGLIVALIALGIGELTGARIWAAIAHLGAIINLFNLIPVWQLDGARGAASMSWVERGTYVVALAGVALVSGEGTAWIIAIAAVVGVFFLPRPRSSDVGSLAYGLLLTLGLGGVLLLAA
jgi:Zn-dependent protease